MRSARILLALLLIANLPSSQAAPAAATTDLAHEVVTLIKRHCAECHTNGKYQGSLSLDERDAILKSRTVVAGKSAQSLLMKRITDPNPTTRMPPKSDPLGAEQIDTLRRWIDEKLPWPENFTFKLTNYVAPLKLRPVTLPAARNGRDHPVDRLVDAYYAKHRLAPPPLADPVTLTRRAHLDLIGLLPPASEVRLSIAAAVDRRTDAHGKLVRRLLSDRRAYADHWLTFWNDLLRNDYAGTGYIDGGRKQITSWLYRALLDNKPYDAFVRELLNPTPESEGFINGIRWRGRVNASQVREIQFSQNVSQVFFGINMKCASCHDSFVDHWKLADAYGLAAIFADQPLEINRCDKPTGQFAQARFVLPALGEIDAQAPRPRRLEQLATLVIQRDNGRFTRTIVNRLWHRLMGRGLVHPVDAMDTAPWSEELLDYLAQYLIDHGYDLKALLEHLCTSQTYQSTAVGRAVGRASSPTGFRGPEVKRMTAEQFLDAVWSVTGTGPMRPAQPFVSLLAIDQQRDENMGRPVIRASLVNADLLMRSLGRPNREQVVTARPDQLTTLQALDLSNGQILHDLVMRGGENLLRQVPLASRTGYIEIMYERALSRKPTAAELLIARELVGEPTTREGLADLLWSVFMLPEFQLIR